MNIEDKKNKLIKARNLMTEVFNDSKENWGDGWFCSSLCVAMGDLDVTISKLIEPKPKGIKSW